MISSEPQNCRTALTLKFIVPCRHQIRRTDGARVGFSDLKAMHREGDGQLGTISYSIATLQGVIMGLKRGRMWQSIRILHNWWASSRNPCLVSRKTLVRQLESCKRPFSTWTKFLPKDMLHMCLSSGTPLVPINLIMDRLLYMSKQIEEPQRQQEQSTTASQEADGRAYQSDIHNALISLLVSESCALHLISASNIDRKFFMPLFAYIRGQTVYTPLFININSWPL